MRLGPLEITFHRTDRVPDGDAPNSLPPSRGYFEVLNVNEYAQHLPSGWEKSGVFLPIYPQEAMWIAFHATHPCALLVGAGGVNAITGEKLGTELAVGNYLVTPPQPWLDGWKTPDGIVRQFVGTHYEGGTGLTVAEQILGEQSTTGAVGFALFTSDQSLPTIHPVQDVVVAALGTYSFKDMGSKPVLLASCDTRSAAPREMGMGMGGKITQKIYPDPYGMEVWKQKPDHLLAVYFVDAETFGARIGRTFPRPQNLAHPGFKTIDGHLADTGGSAAFDALKPVPNSHSSANEAALKSGAFPGSPKKG